MVRGHLGVERTGESGFPHPLSRSCIYKCINFDIYSFLGIGSS